MLQNPILRICMAVYLAIWSPVMCCCAVKSGLGRVTGVQVDCCLQPGKTVGARERAPASCCASAEQADAPGDQPSHPADCKCKSKSRLAISGSPVAKVPGLMLTQLLPAIVAHLIAPPSFDHEAASLDRGWRLAHGPPRDSLFAQHCLLIV